MLFEPHAASILLIALLADAALGDPDWLWRRIPHPVAWMGWLIGLADYGFNRDGERPETRRQKGVAALTLIIALMLGVGAALRWAFSHIPFGFAAEAVIVAALLAQRSLYDHVERVRAAFADGLPAARIAVSKIVGRDPNALDEAGVCRGAIESLAENFSDGVVAPAFWYLLVGLPGLILYKAVNTADSMIGHRSPRYADFGWAAARLDDVLNLIPARLSGLMVVLAAFFTGGDARRALFAMLRDAPRHRSPNAGWPEAATAGALGLALAGPRLYASGWVKDGWMNEGGRADLRPDDIGRALRLFIAACCVQCLLAAILALTTA